MSHQFSGDDRPTLYDLTAGSESPTVPTHHAYVRPPPTRRERFRNLIIPGLVLLVVTLAAVGAVLAKRTHEPATVAVPPVLASLSPDVPAVTSAPSRPVVTPPRRVSGPRLAPVPTTVSTTKPTPPPSSSSVRPCFPPLPTCTQTPGG